MKKPIALLGLSAAVSALAVVLPVSPASAGQLDTVAAVVTGTAGVPAGPPGIVVTPNAAGSFGGVIITGAFYEAANNESYAGAVDAGTVNYSATESTLLGEGTLNTNQAFTQPVGSTTLIDGKIARGSFVRVGVVALAEIDLTYDVNSNNVGSPAALKATAVVTAVPDPVLTNLAYVAGPVVGSGAASPLTSNQPLGVLPASEGYNHAGN